MRRLRALMVVTTMLVAVGIGVVAAFYALIPGYKQLYLSVLAIALIAGLLAYPLMRDPGLGGATSAIVCGSVIYWTVGGASLPNWLNGAALLIAPLLIGFALPRIWSRATRQTVVGN